MLCGSEIKTPEYAIRDFNGDETYLQWLLRHLKRLLTFGLYKYVPWYLPVCSRCVARLKSASLVEVLA